MVQSTITLPYPSIKGRGGVYDLIFKYFQIYIYILSRCAQSKGMPTTSLYPGY
nr:MAG TPA: hypothetical protein [Caudoviricetes sp.]